MVKQEKFHEKIHCTSWHKLVLLAGRVQPFRPPKLTYIWDSGICKSLAFHLGVYMVKILEFAIMRSFFQGRKFLSSFYYLCAGSFFELLEITSVRSKSLVTRKVPCLIFIICCLIWKTWEVKPTLELVLLTASQMSLAVRRSRYVLLISSCM